MKIVHITSSHPTFDIRIFHKECLTLHEAGYDVHLIVPQSNAACENGITIHALNIEKKLSRWQRLYKIYRLTKSITADVYHFHDPEFIPFALLLKLQKKQVIYDVHEDTPQESFSFNRKNYLIAIFKFARWYCLEYLSKFFFNGFVCATPHIAKKFPTNKTVTVRNYVNLNDFKCPLVPNFENRDNTALYVGNIMRIRGLDEMLTAVNMLDHQYNAILKLIGNFSPKNLLDQAQSKTNLQKTSIIGWLDRERLLPHFYSAKVGLALLHPENNFKEALPIKLFEYMAAGLPVIVSDFPLWREIVLNAKCGFVVNPFDIETIKNKLAFIFDHPDQAQKMGEAGRKAVCDFYNWHTEAQTLKTFYQQLIY